MDSPDPYAPPAAQQSSTSNPLADLDLSKLTSTERKFLESAYSKPNISWKMARLLAGLKALGTVIAFSSGKWDLTILMLFLIHIVAYLSLGYWARTWSRLAAFLLFACHIILSYQLFLNDRLSIKLVGWIPALVFFFGYITARSRFELTKKATPTPAFSAVRADREAA